MFDKSLSVLFGNIQGMDAALFAITIVIYKVIQTSKKGNDDISLGVKCVTAIAISLVTARLVISILNIFKGGGSCL